MARHLVNLSLYLLSFITLAIAEVKTGYIPFEYQGSTYQTWYIAYTPEVHPPWHRPLVALHGGPGLSYNYMVSIQDLASNRTVIFYDQIGNGKSTHLDTKPNSFWTVDLFLKELESVIDFFGFDSFDLLGHSWGGMLGAEHAVLRPQKLNKLVLSDSPAAMSLWVQLESQLLSTLPQDVQDGLMVGFSDPVRYRAALTTFFLSYGCTVQPWPAPLNTSFDALFANPTVSIKMGPILSNWTIVDRLKNINVPTLVLSGSRNVTENTIIKPYLDWIREVTHVEFQNSSHTPMWEERSLYMSVVSAFLG